MMSCRMNNTVFLVCCALAVFRFANGEIEISSNETEGTVGEDKRAAIDHVVKALEVLESHAEEEEKSAEIKEDSTKEDTSPATSSILELFTTNLTAGNTTEEEPPSLKKANCSLGNHSNDQVQLVNASALVNHLNVLGDSPALNESGTCLLVMFYAPWCRFSAAAAPHFNALARAYPDVTLMAVDAASAYNMNTRYGIMGVPTFLLFHNGRPVVKYNVSTYTLQEFSDFVQMYTGLEPAVLLNVTTQDFYGPVPSTPEDSRDPWLWASWCFLALLLVLGILRSRFATQLSELIRRTWREAEGLHEHTD